jgi:penicillin-binding protein 1B
MLWTRLNMLSVCITIAMALGVEPSQAYSLNPVTLAEELQKKLNEKNFLPTTEYYVAQKWLRTNGKMATPQLGIKLLQLGYQENIKSSPLTEGQYHQLPPEECQKFNEETESVTDCWLIREWDLLKLNFENQTLIVTQNLDPDHIHILKILDYDTKTQLTAWPLKPQLFAQTVGSQPIMQKKRQLHEMPAACLQAVLAIEDTAFLEHGGVSVTGTLRALVKNLTSGRKAQGGSTITQQLVKNYFLTPERTYKRKFQEMILSVLLESQFTKDQILETYLNIIYMAQNGAYQVIGFPAASEFYFGEPIEKLKIDQCALLAAVLNGPGVFSPFRNPEKALARRNRVLDKMKEQGFITQNQHDIALVASLPTKMPAQATETSPYFIDAARAELIANDVSLENKKVLLTLDLDSQSAAQNALQKHLNFLESDNKAVKKIKETQKKNLEGIVLTSDSTGRILAAVGGRNFRQSQYNRVIKSQRQIGSLIKPFVYLTAIDKLKLNPLSIIQDEKLNIKIANKTWSPENYDRKFLGDLPLYYALKMSLNAATTKLAMEMGIPALIDTLKKFGITKEFEPHPSLSLGAMELSPLEMLGPYLQLSQMGKPVKLTFVEFIWSRDNVQFIFEPSAQKENEISESDVALILGIMKQTLISGTAQSAKYHQLTGNWAGKTGTTSDNRDAWFIGMNALESTLTWVGYDDNTNSKLTGSSGAVPVWINYTKWASNQWNMTDFHWPNTVEKRLITQDELLKLNFALEKEASFELLFKKSFFD